MSFKKGFLMVVLLVVAAMLFGGCGGGGSGGGGGGDDSELTGQFIDAAVKGLQYSCSPSGLNGKTDDDGGFKYKKGDKVTFKVGGVSLGEVDAAEIIIPYSYTTNESDVIKMVRTILSAASFYDNTKITLMDDPYPDVVGTLPGIFDELDDEGFITVGEEDAKKHANTSFVQAYEGSYTGTWHTNGSSLNGTWEMTIDKNGRLSGTARYADPKNPETGELYGTIDAKGKAEASGYIGNAPVEWIGQIDLAKGTLAGTWDNWFADLQGTFTGTKTKSNPVNVKLDGTWKIHSVVQNYGGKPYYYDPTTRTPEKFPVKVISNGSTYTIDVNNGGYAAWEYSDGTMGTGGILPTTSGFKKIGAGEKYQYTEGENVALIELTENNKAVVVMVVPNSPHGKLTETSYLNRQ